MTSSSCLGSNSLFGVTFCRVAPLARLRGGMEDLVLPAESESVAEGKTRQLRDGRWSVQCKWCEEKKTEQADDDSAFYEMLKKCNWRLSNPRKKYINRNWTCPECAQVFKDSDATPTATDTTPTATDAAGSAGQRPRSSTFVRCSAQRGRAAEGGGRDVEGGGLAVEGAAPRAHADEGGTCE